MVAEADRLVALSPPIQPHLGFLPSLSLRPCRVFPQEDVVHAVSVLLPSVHGKEEKPGAGLNPAIFNPPVSTIHSALHGQASSSPTHPRKFIPKLLQRGQP